MLKWTLNVVGKPEMREPLKVSPVTSPTSLLRRFNPRVLLAEWEWKAVWKAAHVEVIAVDGTELRFGPTSRLHP